MHAKLIEHFTHPANVGELPLPAITVEVSNPVCGDILRLSVLFQEGRAIAAGFRTRGCTASIAAGSALTGLILTRGLAAVDAAAIETELGELNPESKHAAALCVDAVREIIRSVRSPALASHE